MTQMRRRQQAPGGPAIIRTRPRRRADGHARPRRGEREQLVDSSILMWTPPAPPLGRGSRPVCGGTTPIASSASLQASLAGRRQRSLQVESIDHPPEGVVRRGRAGDPPVRRLGGRLTVSDEVSLRVPLLDGVVPANHAHAGKAGAISPHSARTARKSPAAAAPASLPGVAGGVIIRIDTEQRADGKIGWIRPLSRASKERTTRARGAGASGRYVESIVIRVGSPGASI